MSGTPACAGGIVLPSTLRSDKFTLCGTVALTSGHWQGPAIRLNFEWHDMDNTVSDSQNAEWHLMASRSCEVNQLVLTLFLESRFQPLKAFCLSFQSESFHNQHQYHRVPHPARNKSAKSGLLGVKRRHPDTILPETSVMGVISADECGIAEATDSEMFTCDFDSFLAEYGPAPVSPEDIAACRQSLASSAPDTTVQVERWPAYSCAAIGGKDIVLAHMEAVQRAVCDWARANGRNKNEYVFELRWKHNNDPSTDCRMDACFVEHEYESTGRTAIVVFPIAVKTLREGKKVRCCPFLRARLVHLHACPGPRAHRRRLLSHPQRGPASHVHICCAFWLFAPIWWRDDRLFVASSP